MHGWGPANGYVYQKAYLEFFVTPELLTSLVTRISADPNITYYAINKRGDLRTNAKYDGPNAVTWGIFPGKEVIQPTIVEAVSFMAWKDEAFELGYEWARVYDANSSARTLITEMMDTYFLVNVVHNDFQDADAIFRPFLGDDFPKVQVNLNGAPKANGVNGHAKTNGKTKRAAKAAPKPAVVVAEEPEVAY